MSDEIVVSRLRFALRTAIAAWAAASFAAVITGIAILVHPEWHATLLHLFWMSWNGLYVRLGTSSAGIETDIAIIALSALWPALLLAFRYRGWKAMRDNVFEAVIGGACMFMVAVVVMFGTQFAWEVASMAYTEHLGEQRKIVDLTGQLQSVDRSQAPRVLTDAPTLEAQRSAGSHNPRIYQEWLMMVSLQRAASSLPHPCGVRVTNTPTHAEPNSGENLKYQLEAIFFDGAGCDGWRTAAIPDANCTTQPPKPTSKSGIVIHYWTPAPDPRHPEYEQFFRNSIGQIESQLGRFNIRRDDKMQLPCGVNPIPGGYIWIEIGPGGPW